MPSGHQDTPDNVRIELRKNCVTVQCIVPVFVDINKRSIECLCASSSAQSPGVCLRQRSRLGHKPNLKNEIHRR